MILRKLWLPLFIAGLLGVTHWQAFNLGGKVETLTITKKLLESETNERLLEQQLQSAVQDVEAAELEQVLLRSDLADAGSAHDGLLSQLTKTRAAFVDPSKYSSVVEQRDAAVRAAMVLSDLLGSCSDRLVELGGAFDQAHARGKSCQATYGIVRDLINKAP